MKRKLVTLAIVTVALSSLAGAANYMYERSSVKGVGYRNLEIVISTQTGYNGAKLGENQSGFGKRHFFQDRTGGREATRRH